MDNELFSFPYSRSGNPLLSLQHTGLFVFLIFDAIFLRTILRNQYRISRRSTNQLIKCHK